MSLILVHDGNISNRNQARALASGLPIRFSSVTEIDASKQLSRLSNARNALIIGCGRRVALPIARARLNGNKTVQILHPRWPLTTLFFDCLVLPFHDRLSWFDDESKIVRMYGALSWGLRQDALRLYVRQSNRDQKQVEKNSLGILLGGQSHFGRLSRELKAIQSHGYQVKVVASRRTPLDMVSEMKSLGCDVWSFHDKNNKSEPNPYRKVLATCQAFAVSSDSISMLADVITVSSERHLKGPIFLLPALETTRSKHVRFIQESRVRLSNHQQDESMNFREFTTADDFMEHVSARNHSIIQVPYEADRVGKLVCERLGHWYLV